MWLCLTCYCMLIAHATVLSQLQWVLKTITRKSKMLVPDRIGKCCRWWGAPQTNFNKHKWSNGSLRVRFSAKWNSTIHYTQISYGLCQGTSTRDLGMRRPSAKTVPRQVSDTGAEKRFVATSDLLVCANKASITTMKIPFFVLIYIFHQYNFINYELRSKEFNRLSWF